MQLVRCTSLADNTKQRTKTKEMEKVNANCSIEVYCTCPHCGAFEDVFEDVREVMDEDHRAENIDVEVKCSECEKPFIIENVYF